MMFPNANLGAAQPAYAPYAMPYVAPRYPLAPIAITPSALATTGAYVSTGQMTGPGSPLTKEFWTQRTLGFPRWGLLAAAAGLALTYGAWTSGMFDGGKRKTSRDLGSLFSFSGDASPRRRKKRRHSRRQRDFGASFAGDFGSY